MRYYQAQDTFAAELDGVHMGATKHETLPESHALVQHDLAHGNKLFKLLDAGEPERPKPRAARREAEGR